MLYLALILFYSSISATDVTAIRLSDDASIETSLSSPLVVLNPVSPTTKKKKKKRNWFKRFQGKVLEKKMAKLMPALYFDSLKCDIIVLRNGEEIEARVLEVNTGALVYEMCDQKDGPKRTLLNSKISMIEYADGYKETFRETNNGDNYERDRTSPRKYTWVVGFALGFLIGLLGLLIVFLIYNDDRYSRKKAVSGALVGILVIVLLTLYLLSLA